MTTTENTSQQLLGYRVERHLVDADRLHREPAYTLHGPRGARYGLMRNQNHPHMMYVINLRPNHRGIVTTAKGYGWFTDKFGELEPVN